MNYREWLGTVPGELTGDSLWKMEAYRLSLFAADLAWIDITKLWRDRRTLDLAGQLYRAIGSVGANLSEGYSRASGKDRARFYEYALGSAREGRTWYFDARHLLGEEVTVHRMQFLTQIIRLLLTMVPDQRGQVLHDEPAPFSVDGSVAPNELADSADGPDLLANVPLP